MANTAAAAANVDSPLGGTVRQPKRARTPQGTRSSPEQAELKQLKEDVKKVTKELEAGRKERKEAKEELQTWYTFAADTRTKLAQYLYYFGEIDKSLMQQRNGLSACEQAIKHL